MAAAKKDWRSAYRCATGKGRAVVPDKRARGTCFVVERVRRNGDVGFTTTLHNRATGRRVAYSAPTEPGKGCSVTQDPFRAAIRPKGGAVDAGAGCARKMSVMPPVPVAAVKKSVKSRRKGRKK